MAIGSPSGQFIPAPGPPFIERILERDGAAAGGGLDLPGVQPAEDQREALVVLVISPSEGG